MRGQFIRLGYKKKPNIQNKKKFSEQKIKMEIEAQENLKSPCRVDFSQQDQKQTTLNCPIQELQINQKTTKHINAQTKSRIFISSQQKCNFEILKEKLLKLIQFITFHHLNHTQIWTNKKQLPISQFSHLLNKNYGFYLTNDQLTALLKICSKKQYLKRSDFQPFGLWLEEPSSFNMTRYSSNLSSQSIHIKKSRKAKNKSQNELNNDQNPYKENFSIAREQILKHSENFKPLLNFANAQGNQGFKEAQEYSKAKVQIKVQQLKKDIKESVLEKKWDFIVMAGEMNQWIDQLKKETAKQGFKPKTQNLLSYRFKVLNKDPVQIIQQNIDTRTSESVPHVVFIKKYQTLKKKMVKQENNKNNLKGTVLMVLEDQDKFSKNVLINRINQRDQQLNFVLLQIMRMKSMFQWQNNILKEAKINS